MLRGVEGFAWPHLWHAWGLSALKQFGKPPNSHADHLKQAEKDMIFHEVLNNCSC